MSAEDIILRAMKQGEHYSARDFASLVCRPAGSLVALLRSMERRGLIRKAATDKPATLWELLV